MKDIHNIEIPCEVYNMTTKQLKDYALRLRTAANNCYDYCQDDPGGLFTTEVEKMYATAGWVEGMLLRMENINLKKELALYKLGFKR